METNERLMILGPYRDAKGCGLVWQVEKWTAENHSTVLSFRCRTRSSAIAWAKRWNTTHGASLRIDASILGRNER